MSEADKSELAKNLKKVRQYFLTHPSEDRKILGLFICDNYKKTEISIQCLIDQMPRKVLKQLSSKSFELTEAEIRALLPEDFRDPLILFAKKLKLDFFKMKRPS